MSIVETAPICVTGANGFIASWVIQQLLNRGYTVHGTVRKLGDKSKYEHLQSCVPKGAEGRLSLFEADLLVPGSFEAAISGCKAVLHCACPFFFKTSNPVDELIRPAVEGTLNVLRTCAKTSTVKRVVVTSSVAAVYVSRLPHDHVYTERDWSDLPFIRETQQHYAESKILAEQAAWDFMKGEDGPVHFTLASVCPTLTLGPLLQPSLNESSAAILELMNGTKRSIPARAKCFVDVRDVADAHIKAMERVDSPLVDLGTGQERYILIAGSWPWRAVAGILREAVPGSLVPSTVDEGPPAPPQAINSMKRVWELGVRYRPIEDSLRDCALSLVANGYMDKVLKANH